MYLQHIFASAANLGLSVESSFLIAIAVLACLFGAEVAGICILIRKMQHAHRDKLQDELEDELNSRHANDGSAHLAITALSFGAIPLATQVAFFALAVLAAVGALVFAIVLIVFLAKGYVLVSRTALKQTVEESTAEAEAPAQEEPVEESAQQENPYAYVTDESEEQVQEAYVAEESFEEESVSDDAVAEEPVIAEEPAEETAAEETAPVTVIPKAEPTVGQAPAAGGIPVYSSAYPGGQMPYVEKYISETYKEVIKETTTTTTTPAAKAEERYSPATEEILKAIAELMKISSQLRTEHEMAVENPAVKNDESVPTFADAEEEDEDVEEVEELDAEDEDDSDAEGDAQEDGDGDDEYESDLFSSNERIVGFDEETGCYIVAHYRKSFEAKLIQSRPNVKKYYSAIKNALLAYEGTKDRITWTINNYSNDRTQIAKINVRTRTLDLYLALDPATLEDTVYHGRDVGSKKKYAETPFLYKVNSPRKLTLALELVQRACEEQGLSPIDIETVNYEEQYPFDTTENLVSRGLIREYLREEKPAVTFELDPDHVPQVPEEDSSVIPVNANFTWEFDNEQPEKEEPVAPEEEPTEPEAPAPVVEEAPVAEEPASAPTVVEMPAAGTTTTTHETVKTTERHYTERYYGTPMQMPYQAQLASNAQPIEALAVPAKEESVAGHEAPAPVAEVPAAEEMLADESVAEIPETEETDFAESEASGAEATETEADPDEIFVWEPLEEEASADTGETAYAEAEEEAYEEAEEEAYEETEEAYEEAEEEAYEETEEAYEEAEEEVYEETEEAYEEVEEEAYEEAEEEAYEEAEEAYEEVEEEVYEEAEEEAYEEAEEEAYGEAEEEAYEEAEEEVYEEAEEDVYEEAEEEVYEEAEAPAPQPISNSNPSVALLDVCTFDEYFESGSTIDLNALKEVGLAPESAVTLKVYASGAVKGQFTVEANHFTLDAIKAIGDADGDSIMIR